MAPRDQYPARGALSSAREFFAITPHNTNDLPQVPRAIWVGTGGDIALDGVVHKGVQSGTLMNVSPTKVNLTGTTAADLVGWV